MSPGVKILACNFYGVANAASERAKFNRNNELLDLIFTVAAQFGDIPILIAGDFQMEPGMYPSVQLALDHWGWADHTATVEGDGQSSIDGILMNRTALTALLDIRVLDHQDRQHRPAQATFAWDRILQAGAMMQQAAKLNLDHIQRPDPADPGVQSTILVTSCGGVTPLIFPMPWMPTLCGIFTTTMPSNFFC